MAEAWIVDMMTNPIHGAFRGRLERLRMRTEVFKRVEAAGVPLAGSKLGRERREGLRRVLEGNREYVADLMVPQVCQANISGLGTVTDT